MNNSMLVHKAVEFAAIKHRDQRRKGSDTPYIVHPVEVALFLTECGCDETCIAAGVLHDTLEDTETTYEELVEQFGEDVAKLVAAESEDKSKSWRERKQATVDSLKTMPPEVLLICLADKLSNLRSMVYDYVNIGDELWTRFNADKDSIEWYYRSIINGSKRSNSVLRERLIYYYVKLFGSSELLDI